MSLLVLALGVLVLLLEGAISSRGGALAVPPLPIAGSDSGIIGLSYPAPSPNGRDLAFVFAGDLWLASMEGGAASRVVQSTEQEVRPFWSPDGRYLLFGRHEDRTENLFLLDRATDAVRRLTEHEGIDVPSGFSPDGTSILFHSNRSGQNRVYELSLEGGEPRPLIHDLSSDGCWIAPDELVFTRSRLPWWRQRARGVGAGELFRFVRGSARPQAVTSFVGVDLWPSYDAQGDYVYYASEESFARNIWRLNLGTGAREQITTHRSGAAEFPQISRDGTRLVYELGGSIWRVDLSAEPAVRKPAAAQELEIRCPFQPQAPRVQHWNAGARGLWVGRRSGELLLEVDGHLFASPQFPASARLDSVDSRDRPAQDWVPLAPSSYREASPSWSPDGSRVVISSDRAGQHDLFIVESEGDGVPVLDSTHPEVRTFRSRFRNEYAPQFSPDGRFIAYQREHEEVEQLLLADAEGGRELVLVDGVRFEGFAFAPDGRWLAYSKRDRSGNAEIYLRSLLGGEEYNLSLHPSDDLEPSWSPDGRYLFFLSDRAGSRDVWAFALRQEDAPSLGGTSWPEPQSTVPPHGVIVDLGGVADRVFQVTKFFGDEAAFSIDREGARVIFISDVLGRPALWMRGWTDSEPTRVSTEWNPRVVRFDPSGRFVWSLDEHGILRRSEVDTLVTEVVPYALSAQIDPGAKREQILVETWRLIKDGFYRRHFHLLDWDATLTRYRARLAGVHTDVDLDTLIRRMMGELNASHLGLRAPGNSPRLATGWLGVEFETDDVVAGGPQGLLVRDVLPGGPGHRAGLTTGDLLSFVAGEAVGSQRPLESILRDRVGQEVELRWRTDRTSEAAPGAGERRAFVRPIGTDQIRVLERLGAVARTRSQLRAEAAVPLGYVRIDGIDRPSLETLERELRVHQSGREGLILDLRENRGGDLPEEFLRLLQMRPGLWREPRGERRQPAPAPLWDKPMVVLIGPDTGSAAEIVAEGLSALGLGTLVGEPTAGGVIGAEEWELVDGRRIRLPRVGWSTQEGDNLEGRGVEPDLWIGDAFERDRGANDPILRAAIKILEDEIAAARSRSLRK